MSKSIFELFTEALQDRPLGSGQDASVYALPDINRFVLRVFDSGENYSMDFKPDVGKTPIDNTIPNLVRSLTHFDVTCVCFLNQDDSLSIGLITSVLLQFALWSSSFQGNLVYQRQVWLIYSHQQLQDSSTYKPEHNL